MYPIPTTSSWNVSIYWAPAHTLIIRTKSRDPRLHHRKWNWVLDLWEKILTRLGELTEHPEIARSFKNITRNQFNVQLGYLAVMAGIPMTRGNKLPILGRLILEIQACADSVGLLGFYNFMQFNVLPLFVTK